VFSKSSGFGACPDNPGVSIDSGTVTHRRRTLLAVAGQSPKRDFKRDLQGQRRALMVSATLACARMCDDVAVSE
jgi:hypothetical protein